MLGPQAHAQGAAPFVLQTVDFQESCDFLLLGHISSNSSGLDSENPPRLKDTVGQDEMAFVPSYLKSNQAQWQDSQQAPPLGDGIRGSKTSLLSTLPWLLQAYSSIHHPWTAKGVHKNQELKHHYITLAFFCHQKDPEFWFWQRSPFAGQPISLASKLANVALLPGNILDQPGEAIGKCCFQSQLVGEMLVRD